MSEIGNMLHNSRQGSQEQPPPQAAPQEAAANSMAQSLVAVLTQGAKDKKDSNLSSAIRKLSERKPARTFSAA